MNTKKEISNQINEAGLLPLYYTDNPDDSIEIANALYNAGVRLIEYTNRGEHALRNFKALVEQKKNMPGLLLAAGTVKSADEAKKFIDAGADFLISPFFDDEILKAADNNKTLWIPGCMTVTEIHFAQKQECNTVKLFPGNILGHSFVSGIRPVFPEVDFIVTGGVEPFEENIRDWFKAGAKAIGMGSHLINKTLVKQKKFLEIGERAYVLLQLIKAIKKMPND
jgi:2-dehydro-3-deoxyphosphogluconate aldolase / (4S)-4-hydroxy-2-oxoglutarate aldolase